MKHQEPLEDWEKALHQELLDLPELEAPATLIPGVLRRINTSAQRPWYRTPWWQWSPAMRTAALAIMFFGVGTLLFVIPHAWTTRIIPALTAGWAEVAALREPLGSALSSMLGAGTTFWQDHLHQILFCVALLMVAI